MTLADHHGISTRGQLLISPPNLARTLCRLACAIPFAAMVAARPRLGIRRELHGRAGQLRCAGRMPDRRSGDAAWVFQHPAEPGRRSGSGHREPSDRGKHLSQLDAAAEDRLGNRLYCSGTDPAGQYSAPRVPWEPELLLQFSGAADRPCAPGVRHRRGAGDNRQLPGDRDEAVLRQAPTSMAMPTDCCPDRSTRPATRRPIRCRPRSMTIHLPQPTRRLSPPRTSRPTTAMA